MRRQEAGVEDVDGFLRSTAVAEKVRRSVLVPPDQQGWNPRRAELRHDSGELRPLRPSSRHEDDAELELGRLEVGLASLEDARGRDPRGRLVGRIDKMIAAVRKESQGDR